MNSPDVIVIKITKEKTKKSKAVGNSSHSETTGAQPELLSLRILRSTAKRGTLYFEASAAIKIFN